MIARAGVEFNMTARNVRVLLMTGAFLAGLVICFGAVLIVTGRNIDDDLWQRAVGRPESFPG